VHEVKVTPAEPDRLAPLLRPERARQLLALGERARASLAGRIIWNVSSTAGGGGVAEMLHQFLRYALGAGVECRWLVIEGTPAFFTVTKRIHNRLHGNAGDGGPLGPDEKAVYQQVMDDNSAELAPMISPEDIVILHDPQTVGLASQLRTLGATVVWRCHIGADEPDSLSDEAWEFLRPWIDQAHVSVFSRSVYAPRWLDPERVAVIPPAIDPLSPKNQPMDEATVLAILGRAGIVGAEPAGASFVSTGDELRPIEHRAEVLRADGPLEPDVRTMVQISRWDRLKDMSGVLQAFVQGRVGHTTGAHLLLVGPDVGGVSDDPEGRQVLDECVAVWRALPAADQATASLVTLPMVDLQENAAIVNAIQRHSAVIAQKSLREGFGLTVAEGMWKARAVVASAVGGIQDQVRDGVDGILLRDPTDLSAFAQAASALLADPERAASMGASGQERVRQEFLADRSLMQWMDLLDRLQTSRS
jgi:trehalose synthase